MSKRSSAKQQIVIKRGTFEVCLYDVGSLMELPLSNLRKLWKIMLDNAPENEDTIQTISLWLPQTLATAEAAIPAEQSRLEQVTQYVEALRRKVAAFGSVATKEQKAELKEAAAVLRYAKRLAREAKLKHERAKKLQTIFNEMAVTAKI